jgi:addiction module RelB/DinJ family antitoxin
MKTAVINIKTDPKVKAEAKKVADELGFSLSSLLDGYMRHLVKTKTVFFSAKREEPSEYLIEAIKTAELNRKRGEYTSFSTKKGALKFVDDIVNAS